MIPPKLHPLAAALLLAAVLPAHSLLAAAATESKATAASVRSLIPLEDFFAEPDMRSVQLSPDGHYLAFLTTLGTGKVGLAFMDMNSGKTEALVASKDENIKVYFWKGNDYIVYGGDIGGNESPAWRSISISQRKVVALAESYREDLVVDLPNMGQLVDRRLSDPSHILIYGNKSAGSNNFQLWNLDIRTGDRRAVDAGDSKVDRLGNVVDNDGNIRARSRFEGEKIVYEVRPSGVGMFSKVAEFSINEFQWDLLGFAADNENLYLINYERSSTGILQTLNIRTKQLGPPLFHSESVEIDGELGPFASYEGAVGVMLSYDKSKLYGVTLSPDKTRYQFTDSARELLQKQIDAALPNTFNLVVSTTQDEKKMVIYATSDRDPGTYYILDLAHPRLMAVGKMNHRINPAQMQPMEPIQYTARDGLVLHGYLTRPRGSEGKKTPLIIHPHGGPFGPRDYWGFNSEVQFLASRGYAVLQVNYRGSGGYGVAFQRAGYHEWGGKMQNDLSDGVKWAIEQGITDADHVAIYGASYGGYAALAGATFTPELYRCAVNYVGVSDLGLIAGSGNDARGSRAFEYHAHVRVGDEPEYLHDRSPVNFVDRIRVPTLHAYGRNDPRVDIKNWDRLEPKLKQYGKIYEILIENNEGHGFRNESNRIAFYRQLESFLGKYMWDIPEGHVKSEPLKIMQTAPKETN